MAKVRTAEIVLEYQNTIENPPIAPEQQYAQACSSDKVTVDSWRDTWVKNITENKKRFGSFAEHSMGKFHGSYKHLPALVSGAGPSLKYNGPELTKRGSIPLVSCLHNFHFMEDVGAAPEFYMTLDAGPVVVEEVTEGGTKSADEYWELSKGRKLIAYIGTDPALFDKWKGEVYFFNAPLPDPDLIKKVDEVEKFRTHISNGGNVLGACMYFAKGILGCNPIAYVGADFCFSYHKKFHAWDSKYDKSLGYVVKLTDVFGNKVLSWQSYANFKNWFEYIARTVPGIWINCSEGGTLGSYPEGNIAAIKQMGLDEFITMYNIHEELKEQCSNPQTDERKILF